MKKINRIEAIEKITSDEITRLTNEDRESYILDWWGIDESNEHFNSLPQKLKQLIIDNDDHPRDIENSLYDHLILIAQKSRYRGTTNEYLSKILNDIKIENYTVHGETEQLEACPCCGFRTLSSIAEYEICALCNWEDSGVTDPNTYSPQPHDSPRSKRCIQE
ncbi:MULTISPECIES: CPCC family cysteine-rich protein [unclassified Pseudomonas]|uniref:CPCC family cysteine-rich protein n=1 Tax=unclassified Pseudomonas TaxID=196821 RepID=UPI000A1F8CDE|nr:MULTISPECIES: CPCC family cysteine-rich protein [unclassified Pseudomonas]